MPVTLADVLPSAAAALGTPGFDNTIGVPSSTHVVVALVDGLGWRQLVEYARDCPFLSSHVGQGAISAAFPSTTPVGLASFGTGMLAGGHGMVGASFLLPETGHVLSPLHWGAEPTPVAVQPEPTVFEAVARSGCYVGTVAPGAYERSGLTRAALRGAAYHPSEHAADRVTSVRSLMAEHRQALLYLYWAELDRAGHEFGVGSAEWRAALTVADDMLAQVHEVLPSGAVMIVTADHGMVNCPPQQRISIDLTPGLSEDLALVTGEPRLRHLYVREGAAASVISRWREVLGERFTVLSREELVDSAWLGAVEEAAADRIGDVVVIAEENWMLTSHTDARVSSLLGQHGSWTPEEMDIPALLLGSP